MQLERSTTRRRLGAITIAIAMLVTFLVACSNEPAGKGDDSGDGKAKQPTTVAEKIDITTTPKNGAQSVSPTAPMKVVVANGSLSGVKLSNEAGVAVKGKQSEDNTTWSTTEPLGYGRTYTWSGNAIGGDGKKLPVKGQFTTVQPAATISGQLNVEKGKTYGIAMPIKVDFSAPPSNRAAVEKALDVQTSPHVAGSWAWLSDTSVHWRPQSYWKPGTKVTVNAKLYGLDMGDGAFGESDEASSFTIGKAQVAKGNTKNYRFKVYRDGKLVKDMPASYGLDSVDWRNTVSGTHVVMEKHPTFSMTNTRNGEVLYKDLLVNWAVRISNNGEFTHSAPWSIDAQGAYNQSHGCVNLSPDNAKWYFDFAQIGDPVEITGSPIKMSAADGDYYDWTVAWKDWTAKSAVN